MRKVIIVLAVVAVVAMVSASAQAAGPSHYWGGGDGNWTDLNWYSGVNGTGTLLTTYPTSADYATGNSTYFRNDPLVNTPGTVTITTAGCASRYTVVGGGTNLEGNLTIDMATSTDRYTSLWCNAGHTLLKTSATALVTHKDGEFYARDYFRVGQCSTSAATTTGNAHYTISGGKLTVKTAEHYYYGYMVLGRFFDVHGGDTEIYNVGGYGKFTIDNTTATAITGINIGNNDSTANYDNYNQGTTGNGYNCKLQYGQGSECVLEVKLSSTGTTATIDVNLDAALSGTLVIDDAAYAAASGTWAIGDTIDILKSGLLNDGTNNIGGTVQYNNMVTADTVPVAVADLLIGGSKGLNRQLKPHHHRRFQAKSRRSSRRRRS